MPTTPRARPRPPQPFQTRALRAARLPLITSALLLAGAALRTPALAVAGADADAAPARFALSVEARYLLLAPLHALLDQLSLLTLEGHAAVLLTLSALGGLAGAWILPRPPRPNGTGYAGPMASAVRLRAALAGGSAALAATMALCAWGIVGDRPMLRLTGARPDELVIDFHAHTEASHDGRPGWSRERLAEWLASAGFHAAYVTDHATLWPESWGSDAPVPAPRAGPDATVTLLPGIEVRGLGEHLNVLGVTARHAALFSDRGRRVQPEAMRAALRHPDPDHGTPFVLVTAPLKRTQPLDPELVHAVEVSDAAPKGLAFGWRHRGWLTRLADSLGLARLSGTDQHGWGRTAASWSVLHLPGWRTLSPEALDRAIRRRLHEHPDAVTVLERPPLVGTPHAWGVALTVPLVVHAVVTRISWRERAACLVWCWGCWGLAVAAHASAAWRERWWRRLVVRQRRARRVRTLGPRPVARPAESLAP